MRYTRGASAERRTPGPPQRWPQLCIVALAAAFSLTATAAPSRADAEPGSGVTLLVTSHVSGELEPCGCTEDQLGGLPRRGSALRAVKAEGVPLLLLDSGNLLFPSTHPPSAEREQWKLKAREIVRAYSILGYDAVGVGRADLTFGADFLRNLPPDAQGLFLSANVKDRESGTPVFRPFRIIKRDGFRVGIFALTHPAASPGDAYEVDDALETARKVVAELGAQVDLLILLSDAGRDDNLLIAAELPEITVIVGADETEEFASPAAANGTFLVQPMDRGRALGRFDIEERNGETPAEPTAIQGRIGARWAYTYRSILLDRSWKEDPEILDLIERYKEELGNLPQPSPQGTGAGGENGALRPELQALLVETSFCRQCHQEVYDFWLTTKHSRAYATLVEENYEQSPECLKCHTTGPQLVEVDWPDTSLNPRNVQCVACHRTGHRPADSPARTERIPAEVCLTCHTPQNSANFDYETYYTMIRCPAQ